MFNNVMTLEEIIEKVYQDPENSYSEIAELLMLQDRSEIERLFSFADSVRQEFMGSGVLLRGIVEFSNRCSNSCFYCGLNKDNKNIARYSMSADEVLDAVGEMHSMKIRTVVLQSGEDRELDPIWLAGLIKDIKKRFGLAVTVSVGEKSHEEYKLWREAGADRYLLKVETTDPKVYSDSHAMRKLGSRMKCLDDLSGLGYQTGSGLLIGLRGQAIESIVKDILYLKEKDFDMIGIGPFISHGDTPFALDRAGDVELTLKTLAVTRIVTRNAHMPATTAIGSSGGDHRVKALKAGANVLMPNFTPSRYKRLYSIYPGKACITERTDNCISCMRGKAGSIGRFVDYSVGHSIKKNRIFNMEGAIYE
ncbi:MAG: [FeFe] hydrogenase H-cluster radical SAM maturase HydE [Candidatus Omnitrophota bacterium]|jgi:biotin synthase